MSPCLYPGDLVQMPPPGALCLRLVGWLPSSHDVLSQQCDPLHRASLASLKQPSSSLYLPYFPSYSYVYLTL